MDIFHVAIQRLDENGFPVTGNFAQSVLTEGEIKEEIGWLVTLAKSGKLSRVSRGDNTGGKPI